MGVYHFEVLVDKDDEETTLELFLLRFDRTCLLYFGHNYLHFGEREARLLEVGAVLSQNGLPLVLVFNISIVKRVGDNCVVFISGRNVFLVWESRS